MTFGERVRTLRKKRKMSQNALATLSGLSPRTIFGYEAGTTFPRTQTQLFKLADVLNVSVEELVSDTPPWESLASIQGEYTKQKQIRLLTSQIASFLRDSSLSDEVKDRFVRSIMNIYWESKEKGREQNMTAE